MFTPTCNYVYISRCMSDSKYQFCHCKSDQKFRLLQAYCHQIKNFQHCKFGDIFSSCILKNKNLHLRCKSDCMLFPYNPNDMYLPTLHFVTVPLTCANYLAQSLRFSKQNVYYVCLVDATVLRGSCLAQKNSALTQGNHIKGDFLGRIYQNVFNKRIRPTKINPRNSRSSNRSERV